MIKSVNKITRISLAAAVFMVTGVLLILPCSVVSAATPVVEPKPPVFDLKSYDLSKINWYASADLPPDSTIETIRARGTPTTPTVTLRSTVYGGSGILFCFIQLPESLPAKCSGRITIGDIDGDDEAFWNGRSIGKTTGWGRAEFHPRMYTMDRGLLKSGINIFALKMTGPGGRPTFGVKSKTLTFCLTPPIDPPVPAATDNPTSSIHTIDIVRARSAILAADPKVTTTLLQRKRPSFGRFGEFMNNGLPAVSEISPTRIATRRGPSFDVMLDRVTNVKIHHGPNEPGIDGWHQISDLSGVARGTTVSYSLRQNVLYPGAAFTLDHGSVLQLRVRFPETRGQVFPLSDGEAQVVFGGKNNDLAVFGFVPVDKSSTPAIIAVTGLSVNITQASAHMDISLARKNGADGDARIYIFYPTGLYRFDGNKDMKTLSDIARAVRPNQPPVETLRQWLRIGLYEPVGVDEYFTPVDNESRIRIFQVARYRSPKNIDLGGPLLIRPPQVDFAQQALGYPIQSPETSSTGVLAFSGDMHYSAPLYTDEAKDPDQRIYVIDYDLPVPPLHERAIPEMYNQENIANLINQYAVKDLGTTTSVTAVDALYKSRTQAYQSLSWLNPENRKKLSDNSIQTVTESLGGRFWNHDIEPFSGLDYWFTSYLQGPYFKKYDQDWGNGLSLYGLETYVKYSGNWKLPAANWDAVERIFRWFTVTDDWEWMRASNSAHGYGTGAGDSQNATYAAAVAYSKLARGVGNRREYDYGLYTLARAALIGLNRFGYNDFAASNDFKGVNSMVLGFHEGQGFLEGELTGYPWNVTSNISGNGIQTENHDLYMKYAQDALRNYEQIFEKNFPNWMEGNYKYPGDTMYKGNSGYITLPHIYLRARLNGDSFATLNEYLDHARGNSYLWWLAPPVLVEVAGKKADGVYVTDWENAEFVGSRIEKANDEDRRKLTLKINNRDDRPNTVSIKMPRRPHSFDINGGPVPLTDSQYKNGELKLKIQRPGENTITVVYSDK